MERRLIAKLDMAGQLRPGYLLRALREQKLSLFIGGLATLGRFEPAQVRRGELRPTGTAGARPAPSVGIDRSVFPTILELVRGLNEGPPGRRSGGRTAAPAAALCPSNPTSPAPPFRQAVKHRLTDRHFHGPLPAHVQA